MNSQQQSGGFVPMSGVEIPTGLDEHSVAQYDRKVLNNGPTLHGQCACQDEASQV